MASYTGFKELTKKFRSGITNPGALAAAIGRRKYGKAGFAALSRAGKRARKKTGKYLSFAQRRRNAAAAGAVIKSRGL
jgi:hypothetical protein